jgi:DNA polymerase III subunit beta
MIVLKSTQQKLLNALQEVSGIVDRRHTLPILANVLLRKRANQLEMITSDLDVQVQTVLSIEDAVQESVVLTLGARKLIEILRSMSAEQAVSLSLNGSKAVLQAGKSRFTLQSMPGEDFPLVQEAPDFGPTFCIPQKILKQLINHVHFAMAVQDLRYYLNGILFVAEGQNLVLVATDGHRLAWTQTTLETEIPRQEVILPRKTVLELQRLLVDDETPIEISFASNQARFKFSNLEFITKLVEGKFPDYNRVIPKNHKYSITVSRQSLLSSLQRAAILTPEKFKGVHLHIEPGVLKISSKNTEQEEANEEIEIDYNGENIETGFNVTYLIDILNHNSEEMVRIDFLDGYSSLLFTIPEKAGFKYVVMPMKI